MNKITKLGLIAGVSLASINVSNVPAFAAQFSIGNGTAANSLNFFTIENLLGQRFTPSRSTPTGNPNQAVNPVPAGSGNTVLLKNFSFFDVVPTSVQNSSAFSTLYLYELTSTAQNVALGSNPANITAPGWTLKGTATGGLSGTTATWTFAGNGLTINTSGTQYAAIAGSLFDGAARTDSYTPAFGNISPFNTPSTGFRPFIPSDDLGPGNQIQSSTTNPRFGALFDNGVPLDIPENFSVVPGLLGMAFLFGFSKLTKKEEA